MTLNHLLDIELHFKDCLADINHPMIDPMQFDTPDWQRCDCPTASKGNANVSYKVHTDRQPCLKVQCHKCHPEPLVFKFGSKLQFTSEQYAEIRREAETRRAEQTKQSEVARVNALIQIQKIWDNSTPCLNHAYFKRKGLSTAESDGLRMNSTDRVLCPVRLITGELISLQTIPYTGKKLFHKDTSPSGGFHVVGSLDAHNEIFFSEGIATCLTIRDAINKPAICLYGKHFADIAPIIAKAYPDKKLIYCCDLPSTGEKSTSQDNAKKAIALVGGHACLPDFSIIPNKFAPEIARSDFNDLFYLLLKQGKTRDGALLEVRRQIQQHSDEKIMTENVLKEKPQALPDALPKVLPFDPQMLPESIRDYVSDVTSRQQCPIDFVAVSAICGLAALLGRKALMYPKQNDTEWKVTPNIWGAIIGRPSAMKSPAMKAALEPLRRIDSDAAKQYQIAKEEYEVNIEFAELTKSTAKDIAKQQMKDKNKEAAKKTLMDAIFTEKPPTRKRLIVNDASVEKLGELLNENPNGLILSRDELAGWLAKLAREEHQVDRAFYIECFDGNGHYTYDRIGRGTIDIQNTTLSVIGGIQPSRIAPLIRDAIRGTADDGLVQRLQLAVWPDDIGNWKWIDHAPKSEAQKNFQNTFDNLHALSFQTKDGESPCYRFTKEAQKLFIQWMEEIQTVARSDDTHPALESHLLKMPKTIASLALLFQTLSDIQPANKNELPILCVDVEKSSLFVGELATAQALEWADYLKSHAERLYSICTSQALDGARLILKRIDKLKNEFTARDIQRKEWTGLTEIHTVEEALIRLVDYNHLSTREIPSTSIGGRPTVCFIKNKKYTEGSAK